MAARQTGRGLSLLTTSIDFSKCIDDRQPRPFPSSTGTLSLPSAMRNPSVAVRSDLRYDALADPCGSVASHINGAWEQLTLPSSRPPADTEFAHGHGGGSQSGMGTIHPGHHDGDLDDSAGRFGRRSTNDHFKRLMSTVAMLSMLTWMATPALAGHNHPSFGHGHGHGDAKTTTGTSSEGNSQHAGAAGNPHSNEGGELRGLDRANQAAGSHGQQGRDEAATNQPDSSSSDSDSDSE